MSLVKRGVFIDVAYKLYIFENDVLFVYDYLWG